MIIAGGVAQAQYDQVMQILNIERQKIQGLNSHCAGSVGQGFRVCDVWESQEAIDTFFKDRLGPALQQARIPPLSMALYPLASFLPATAFTKAKSSAQANALNAVFEIPGGDQSAYNKIMSKLNLAQSPQQGQIAHAAGPIPGGWRVVDTWESKEALDAFFHDRLGAILQQVGWNPIAHLYPLHRYLLPNEIAQTATAGAGYQRN
jgi:hypothetical protein